MTKMEVSKLLNKIKGYYSSQFFIDEYITEAWVEMLEPYDLEDALEHIQTWVMENPEQPPKPQTFIKGLYTHEEKIKIHNSNYTVECNLCHKFMTLEDYDNHYDRCLDIQYLVNVARQKGEDLKREDLEYCRPGVIEKLLQKYPPKKIELGDILNEL